MDDQELKNLRERAAEVLRAASDRMEERCQRDGQTAAQPNEGVALAPDTRGGPGGFESTSMPSFRESSQESSDN